MSKVHILPNLRKGLSKNIEQNLTDQNGFRAGFMLRADFKGVKSSDDSSASVKTDSISRERKFILAGPADIKSVNQAAISQVVPVHNSSGYSKDYMPYVEFYEEDFPWRYTPLPSSDKLKPWLLLLACKSADGDVPSEYVIKTDSQGFKSVAITPSDNTLYPSYEEFHKLAHVQITTPDSITGDDIEKIKQYIKDNPDDGISRLFCNRPLEADTAYTIFLVPAFELGRRAGLGENLSGAKLDQLSWNPGTSARTFPVYYQWTMRTGSEKFMKLAGKQRFVRKEDFEALPDGLKVDISETGLRSYKEKYPAGDDSTPIDVPVALVKNGFDEDALVEEMDYAVKQKISFGDVSARNTKMDQTSSTSAVAAEQGGRKSIIGEGMAEELMDLLQKSPVFSKDADFSSSEDPWIVPTVYGARHILADKSDLKDDTKFFKDLNLKFRNRTAAGLGVSVVKKNQEAFTNRAWGMVEEINALNQRIREFYESWKLNGAAAKKTTDLGEYKFAPSASGLQTDAAIRVASAQSSADIDALTLATDVSGNDLNLRTAVMGPLKKVGGVSINLLDIISDIDNWNENKLLLKRITPGYKILTGMEDYFSSVDPRFSFLKTVFKIGYAEYYFNQRDSLVKSDPDTPYMTFEADNITASIPRTTTYGPVKDAFRAMMWTADTTVFKFNGARSTSTLESLAAMLEGSRKEFDQKWGENLGETTGFLHQMCLPITAYVHPDATSSSKYIGYAVYMKEKAYAPFKEDYPDGFCVLFDRPSWQVKGSKLYILPESMMKKATDIRMKYARKNKDDKLAFDHSVSLSYDSAAGKYVPKEGANRDYGKKCYWYINDQVSVKELRADLIKSTAMFIALKHLNENLQKRREAWGESTFQMKWGQSTNIYTNLQNDKAWLTMWEYGLELYCSYPLPNSRASVTMSYYIGYDGKNSMRSGDQASINAKYLCDIVNKAVEGLEWLDSVMWWPNEIHIMSLNLPELDADKMAGSEKLFNSIDSSYESLVRQIEALRKSLEAKSLLNPRPAPKQEDEAPLPKQKNDADQANRDRLVALANEFASKGITLNLGDSNFDGKYPIMAYPIFPDPTSFYLRELSERFILPSVEKLKKNSISCFITNPVFEEAFLAGMNTEMGRELLWREYPTDERGSYFRKFWDQVELPSDFKDDYFDVKYLHKWNKPLGENHEEGKGRMIVFVVKSELMEMYPQTTLCLASKGISDGKEFLYEVLSPKMTGWLSDDAFMAGFDPEKITSTEGIYLAFVETDKSQRFSLVPSVKGDTLSSDFAVNRKDDGSVWGIEIAPEYLKIK